MEIKRLTAPFSREEALALHAGDAVLLSGTVYTARDAAHKRMCALLEEGKPLPFPLEDALIYYVGPTPARAGEPIGSAGPTTSSRMDAYAPRLIRLGLRGMIGKGLRAPAVVEAMTECGAVYFGATGGAGALIARSVVENQPVAYEDLGSEAIHRLTVRDMPLTVVIDAYGCSLYETGPAAYRDSLKK
ncbi:MAG: Fe-S-containing hydro-lyase [Provencibacterium sp.]|jgi:fumarate hydratase subunit beta|nr:Fe-S-containing hydro-lyase [Provencibacterium sp.]